MEKQRFLATFTVTVEIKADTLDGARGIAKDFRRSIGIGTGVCHPRGIPTAVCDETMKAEVHTVRELSTDID